MGDKISFKRETDGKSFDVNGKIISKFNKTSQGIIDSDDFQDNKISIDAQMMTHAITDNSFKYLLKQNIGSDFPYTTEVCRKETIGNLVEIMKISYRESIKEFEELKNELSIKFLEFKEEYAIEGKELFDKIISSGMKIKNKRTFLKDCVNIITIIHNKVNVFFCNDEELEKACKRMNINLRFERIADSSQKVTKDFFNSYFKYKYQRKGRKARR